MKHPNLKYWPECFHALLVCIFNIVLVIAVSNVVLQIYNLSESLWSLAGLLALVFRLRVGFTRD